MGKNRGYDDEKRESDDHEKMMIKVWDCGSPLYDSYELASLTHLIERHLMALPNSLGGSKRFRLSYQNLHQKKGSTAVMAPSSSSSSSMGGGCIGFGRVWKKMRGERAKKMIKPTTRSRTPSIKWFI